MVNGRSTLEREENIKPSCKLYLAKKELSSDPVPFSQSSDSLPQPSNQCKSSPQPSDSTPDDLDIPIAFRKGVRNRTKYPISDFVSYDSLSSKYRGFVSSLSSVSIPQNWKDAFLDPKWKEAMVEEMKALVKNETWELVTPPAGKRPVGFKWVFTVKHKADGSIER